MVLASIDDTFGRRSVIGGGGVGGKHPLVNTKPKNNGIICFISTTQEMFDKIGF